MPDCPVFTKEMLPVGMVMLLLKLESGLEFASVVKESATDLEIVQTFRALVELRK